MPEPGGVLAPDWPAPANVRAVSTERHWHGIDNFNLADHVGDDPRRVAENRRRLIADCAIPGPVQWLTQVHGDRVVRAGETGEVEADACYTTEPGVACAIMTADCLPVLFCDQNGSRVAAAHAGWRGLCAGILVNTLRQFPAPARVLAWLGPAIGPRHFEVGAEVRDRFMAEFKGVSKADIEAAFTAVADSDHKYLCDLCALARAQLRGLGVVSVSGGHWCTVEDNNRFFSYRAEAASGRHASLVWLHRG